MGNSRAMPVAKEPALVSVSKTAPRDPSAFASLGRSLAMLSAVHHYRDPFTVQHQHRTAELSAAIALELRLSTSEITVLRLAASVHDIGKIAVPTEILFRPDALSDLEYAVIKTHSAI